MSSGAATGTKEWIPSTVTDSVGRVANLDFGERNRKMSNKDAFQLIDQNYLDGWTRVIC